MTGRIALRKPYVSGGWRGLDQAGLTRENPMFPATWWGAEKRRRWRLDKWPWFAGNWKPTDAP